MKKSDIKNGMHVITNEGKEYVVIIGGVETLPHTANGIMVRVNEIGWMPFEEYDDDLHYHDPEGDEYNLDSDYDIKAVYAPRQYSRILSSINTDNFIHFTKVWERPIPICPKKMTKAEIESELGYKIEIVD